MKKLVFLSLAIVLHTFSTGVEAADGALAFTPASQQYVEVPNFHTLGVTNEVTIEFWAFTNAAGNHSAFILEADAGGNRCQMHTAYSNGQTFWDFGSIVGNAGRLQVATPSGTVGAWTHWAVVASASGSFMKIYRDGVEVATKTGMDDFSTSTARSLRIGGNTGLFFDGQLDEFRVWNVARTASEIAANRHVPLTGSEAGLRLYLKLDETSGTTAVNSATATGAAYDGTLVNAPVRSTRPVLVTTLANELDTPSGADLSLREALRDAAVAAGADSISFAPALAGGTITLSAGIAVNNAAGVTVDATSLPGGITIDAGAGTNRVFNIASGGVITLNGLTLTGGSTAGSDDGGAIRNDGTLTMSRCTLTGNAASDEGGAIFNTGTLSLTQCTLSGNTSGRNGGAIMSFPGTVTLTQCTVAGNTATSTGGGVSSFGSTVSLTNCLIAGNTAPSGPDLNGGTYTRSGVNLIGKNGSVTTLFPAGQPNANGDFVGTNAAPLNAQLDALADYGGPAQTRRLLAGSPALNRIASPAFTVDQRGLEIVGLADIGAYESQVGTIAALAINEDATTGTLPFGVGTVDTLTATSSNTALVPNANLILGGSGSSRTLAATPLADAIGTTTITVTDSPSGEAASFTLTVTAVNDAPRLNAISNPAAISQDAPQQTINLSGIGTGAANETQTLTITATSSNTALIPHPTVTYTSPNTTGTLAYTPVADVNGSAVITVTVNDGQASNNTLTRTFTVVVTPPQNLVTHTGDSGPGSLRQVVSVMLGFSGSQTITFAPGLSGQTITLASEISLTDPNNTGTDTLTLDASSLPGGLTIDGGPGTNRIFFLAPGDRAVLNGLTLTGGNGVGSVINNSGGAIYNHNGILTLTECTLSGNSVNGTDALGGAIYHAGGTLTLAQCILSDNSVTGTNSAGGAIANDGTLTLTECTLAGNTTSQSGGAIYNLDSASLARCTLSGNSANDGGAILNVGTLSLTGCTLAGNSVPSVGGAIYSGSGSLTLTRCTLSGNSASYLAGAIFSQTTVTLTNSLIAGNTAFSAPDIRFNGGTVNRSGVNLIGSNDSVTTPFPSGQPNANGDFVGTNAAPLSPQLDVLGSYGGPTQTRRLLAGSPALNRIASPAFTTDQRGFPIVGAADIGAYESQVGAIAALAINEDAATGALPFSVGTVGTLTATSSNTALVPNASITLGGSGSSRTLAATPLADANGTTTITVTDSPSGEAASFTLTVTAVNDTPTLNAISNPAAINEDASQQTINLSGIGTGAANETQTLTVTATSSNTALIPHPTVTYTSPNTTGSLAYTPVANASGSAIITVTVNDGQAANNTRVRTFTVVVNAVNDAPVAVADAQTIAPKTTLKFAATKLVVNDTDLEGGTLTVVSVQSPSHGATVSLGSGTITYIPAAAFTGAATFTYTISDGMGGFANGVVTITVNGTDKVVLKDTQMRVTSAGTITNAVELDGTGGLTSDQPVTLGGQVTVKGTPVIDTSSNITISGPIDGDGRLEKTGSGRLNLTSGSTFTGGFKATQGVVGIGDNAALGTGTVTLGGAGIESVGARRVLANPVEITGNTVVSGPGIGLSGPVKLSGRRGIQTDGNLDIDGPVQDEGGPAKITKRGGGDLILGGENTFSGGVDVKEGTLALAKDAAAGTGPVVLSGGELEAIGDRELDNPVELKADAVLKGDKMKLNGPVAVSGEKTLTTETDVELRGTVKSDTPGTTTKLNKEGKGKLTNASTAKNEVDVEVQDGRYSNEGRSRGTTRAPSDAPAEQADSGLFSSQAIVGGAPAVSFYDKKNGDLKYMRATKQDGTTFSPPVTVDATGDVGASTSLLVVDGHPAIAYREGGGTSGRLKYVRANDQWGREWGTPVVVSELKSNSITLQVVSGRPAIAFYATEGADLCFVRASDVTGTAWSTVRTVASEGDVGLQASMVIVNGKPAILCLDATNNQLVYFRATSATDWGAGIKVASSTAQKGVLSLNSAPRLQVISGRPAVCYFASVKASPEAKPVAKLLYKRADDADGATWPAEATTMLTPSGPVGYTSLAVVGNVPALSYVKATDSTSNVIEYVWAADADGASWPAANLKTLRGKAGGSSTSLCALADGLAGISFYGGNSRIDYASFTPEPQSAATTPDERTEGRARRDERDATQQPDSPPDRKNPDTGGKNGKNKPVKDQGSGSNAQAPAPDPGRPPAAGPPPSKPPAKSGGYTSGDYSGKEIQEQKGSATTRNGRSPGMSEDAEDVIWADGTTIVWDINDASGLPGLNWDYFKVGGLFEIDAASTDPIYFEIESLLPDNTAGPVTHFSPYVAQTWKIVSAGAITGFAADKFVISTEGFANDLKGGSFSLAQSSGELHLVFTPATTLAPEITVLSSSVSLGSGSALDVGTLAASAQTTRSYTVRNDGSGPLSGIRIENASVLIGNGSLTFDVPEATTLAPGASLTFDATLTNEGIAADGIVAAFTLTSDDADESIFPLHLTANAAVVPAPEIAVAKTAGNVDLTSGSLTPVNFGNVSTAASTTLDFTLANTGNASLSGIDFIIDGPHSIDFHLIAENLSDVDGAASGSFQIEFEPSAAGVRQATLFIRSNDSDENPFIVHLTGTGDATPEIAITGAGRSLADGDPSPVDFGTLAVNAHQDISFSIANIGTLDLTGLTLSLTGADASQFSIQTGLTASTLAPADAAPVVIRFAPASAGVKHANLQITSNDSDEPVFDITLTGEGSVAAELVLENAAAVSLGLNESADFGTVLSGESAALTFTIKNIGSADLTGLTLSLSGDAAADYSLGALSTPAPLAGPAGVSTFTLTFSPSASGIRNAALLIESNDADEGQFVIYLTGTGTLPPSAPTDILLSSSTVIENSGPGTLIGTLTAVDANLGQSHTFTLAPGAGDTHNVLFGISSGDLVLNANADFESLTTYSIRVQADDGSGGTFAKTFSITVTDANDAPLITSSLGGSSAAISVAENTTAVTTVTASDPDSPAQTLLHSITGGADAARFAIVPATGVLTFLTAPSFEAPSDLGADNIYEVLITATDSGTPALSDTQLISVTVTDAPEPEIALSGNAVAILAGDVSHFGDTAVTGGSVVRVFTITNSGLAALTLTGTAPDYVTLSGSGAGHFSITAQPASGTLAAGGTQTFQITFDPSALGTHTATVSIASDDEDENSFTFDIRGNGASSHFTAAVSNWAAANNLAPGDSDPGDDPDGDGKTNLEEFAFGTHPGTGSSGSAAAAYTGSFAAATLTATGQPLAQFEPSSVTGVDYRAVFVRRADHSTLGLTYTVQFSADMTTWQTTTVIPTVLDTAGGMQLVSVPYPLFVKGKRARFFHVVVSQP